MKYFCLLLLFLPFCAPAQTPEVAELKAKVKSYLFKKPDSAKIYLFKLLEYSDKRPDSAISKTYSNLGITYNQMAVYDSAEVYFKKAVALAEGHPKLKAEQLCNLAINFRTMAQYHKSLAALETALDIYTHLDDDNGIGLVYGEMASNYSYMLDKEKAISYLKKAIELFKQTDDPRLYILQQKLANAYFNNGKYDFAIALYEEVLPTFEKNKNASYYLTLLAYAESLVETGKVAQGEARLEEAKKGLKEVNNLEYMHVAQGKLGKIYAKTERLKKAEQALQQAFKYLGEHHSTRFLEIANAYVALLNKKGAYVKARQVIRETELITNNFQEKLNAAEEMDFLRVARTTYRQLGNYKEALEYGERAEFLNDSLNQAVDNEKIRELEATYQNEIQKERNASLTKHNALLRKYNERQKTFTIISSVLAFILLLMAVLLYRFYQKKMSLQRESLSNLESSNKMLKENQILEQELREEKENSLAIKERELVAISLEVSDIQNQIRDLLEKSTEKEISGELAAKILVIINQRNYWKHFKMKFIEVHPDFSNTLVQMFPDLSENDIAFCSMLKLQLSNKEIASLMGISHQSVISKKYRIKKKMNLQDSNETFEDLIRDL